MFLLAELRFIQSGHSNIIDFGVSGVMLSNSYLRPHKHHTRLPSSRRLQVPIRYASFAAFAAPRTMAIVLETRGEFCDV
jgi:hypothetical protein